MTVSAWSEFGVTPQFSSGLLGLSKILTRGFCSNTDMERARVGGAFNQKGTNDEISDLGNNRVSGTRVDGSFHHAGSCRQLAGRISH